MLPESVASGSVRVHFLTAADKQLNRFADYGFLAVSEIEVPA